ncbi:MAG: glycine cleavage system protein GcvH [Candidatus Sumerlaeia bacterium]|nr:glycine cleavage system protein GcvH [Candidatus Sumerlaeia bacterium]
MANESSYLYTESHEWVEAAGDARRVGITDHAQQLMGDIVFADLPAVGRVVKKGEEILSIESPKAAASVYAPLSGEVVEVNGDLAGAPDTINKSPYADGWLVKIRPSAADAESATLKSATAYKEFVGE